MASTTCRYCGAHLCAIESVTRGYGRDCAALHGVPYGPAIPDRRNRGITRTARPYPPLLIPATPDADDRWAVFQATRAQLRDLGH